MTELRHWYLVSPVDVRARLLADRHYSRQTPGAREWIGPGNKIALIVPNWDGTAAAVWASQRPAPNCGLDVRSDGFEYWNNVIFRNESNVKSSELIREAVAITKYFWGDLLPANGFHTFVDPRYVKGVKVHGETVYGWCFIKAGFDVHPQRTRKRNLIRLILPSDQLITIEPIQPMRENYMLFEAERESA